MVCKRILLSGKVQGVSFRFHTHAEATRLGVKGFVQNLNDGRVEIVVCAEDAKSVDALLTWAKKGPIGAQVEKVEVAEVKDSFPSELFYIRREGVKW